MKVSDLAYIQDPHVRMVQAHKFLRQLARVEAIAVQIRNEAAVQCQATGESYKQIGESLGVNRQRVGQILQAGREANAKTSPPFKNRA